MKKITYLSNLLMASFIVYIFWIVISYFYSWFIFKYPVNTPMGFNFGAAIHSHSASAPPDIFTMKAPMRWKIVYSMETLFIFALYLFFAANAARLFWLYSTKVIFDLACVKLIKRAGFALFAINLLHLICPAINTYMLSNQIQKISQVLFFGTDQATIFVISLLLIVTSWIMEESYKIHDEQRYTV